MIAKYKHSIALSRATQSGNRRGQEGSKKLGATCGYYLHGELTARDIDHASSECADEALVHNIITKWRASLWTSVWGLLDNFAIALIEESPPKVRCADSSAISRQMD